MNGVRRLLAAWTTTPFTTFLFRSAGTAAFSSRHAPVNVMLSSVAKQANCPESLLSLSLFSLFLFLRVGVSITAALRAQWNHLGSLSNPYSCLGGVSQTGESWRRCTGHKDETAAPCLKIAQIISSTHVSIEAAVAMETHPPSASSSSTER